MCDDNKRRRFEEDCRVISNEQVGPRLYDLRLAAPQSASRIEPGQFVHMALVGYEAHMLRRPFSVYQADGGVISVIYQVVGQGTAHMTSLAAGDTVNVISPLGHGWPTDLGGRTLVVGGGVGAAPLFMEAKLLHDEGADPEVMISAQTAEQLFSLADYTELLGREPLVCTDNGSYGMKGFVTEPLREQLATGAFSQVLCCGPEPMMRIVASACAEMGVPCYVSMEKRMACGIGACLSCIVETVDGRKRSCVDGPVFKAEEVVW